jgi:UDP-N-acetylmuramoyl-L-alanyl-D-glutamate--2,6-diaminopimelate ligase
MPKMVLKELLSAWTTLSEWPSILITSITHQSAKVEPGALFLAYRNDLCDRTEFIEEAVSRGALAVAVDAHRSDIQTFRSTYPHCVFIEISDLAQCWGEIAACFYNDPTQDMVVIGVTGTNGKSSTAYFICQALNHFSLPCAFVGTIGMGMPDDLQASPLTTLDPITFQEVAANFKQQGVSAMCIEMSSHALSQNRLNGVNVHTSVLTQITSDHLDYHGSLENYKAAKEKCMQLPNLQLAVLNLDDLEGRRWLGRYAKKLSIIGYGAQLCHRESLDLLKGYLWIKAIVMNEAGLHINFQWQMKNTQEDFELFAPLAGHFNTHNIAATIAVLLGHGYSIVDIQQAVATIKGAPGRMQRLGGAGLPTIYVDYAHTTDALQKALEAVKAHTHHAITTIFGCGGDRDTTKRFPMGQVAAQFSDTIVLTNDNPRSEDPMVIIEQVKKGIMHQNFNKDALIIELDREKAILESILKAEPTDVFLIAGKGHECQQMMNGYVLDCDDRAIVLKALDIYKKRIV